MVSSSSGRAPPRTPSRAPRSASRPGAEIGAAQLGAVEEVFRALTDRAAVALGREADVEIVGLAERVQRRVGAREPTRDVLGWRAARVVMADLRRVRSVFKEGAESAGSGECFDARQK